MKKREKIKNKIEMPTSSFVSLHAPYTGRICRYTAAYSNLDFYSNLHLLWDQTSSFTELLHKKLSWSNVGLKFFPKL
jgi:hypothetical protein